MKRLMTMCGVVAAMTGGAMAAPLNQGHVSADAKWVLHVDVDSLKSTQVGQILMQRLTSGQENNKLNALAAMLGTDLRKDLSGVTLFSVSDREEDGVVVLNGRFNTTQLDTIVKANKDYSESTVNGVTVRSWTDEKKNKKSYGAIVSDKMIVMSGGEAAIKAALTAIGGSAPSLVSKKNPALDLDGANSAVVIAAADMASIKSKKPNAQTFKQAKSAAASVAEQGADMVGHVTLQTDSAENAQHMADAVRGIVALVQLDDKTDPKTKEAIAGTKVDLKGTTLDVTLRMPAQTLADAMQKKILEDDAKKAAAPKAE